MDFILAFLCPGCGLMFIAGRYSGRISCSLFCGVWLLRGLLVLACIWESCIGLMPFPRFLGEVLSVLSLFG